ncbi:MAG: hypothetical protein NTW19_10625 [Planctomycetota bacterium]|nr:hypothetical protein [Planctomycetota bacterium]
MAAPTRFPLTLASPLPSGLLQSDPAGSPLAGGAWFKLNPGEPYGSSLAHACAPGQLLGAKFIAVDILLDSDYFVTMNLSLAAGDATVAAFGFSPLTQCQTRVWFNIAGADLAKVDRVIVKVLRAPGFPARLCLAPLAFSIDEPARLENPLLPKGPIVDEMGQSALHDRPGKTRTPDELVARLRRLHDGAPATKPPANFSKWGGWKDRRVEATGFFRTHHDGRRWWLVDPEGHLFWSAGVDCVHPSIDHETYYQTRQMNLRGAVAWPKGGAPTPEPTQDNPYAKAFHTNPWHSRDNHEFNFVEANFIRAFGPGKWHDAWTAVAASELRTLGFNTAGDWSDEPAMARAGVPYCLPLDLQFRFPSVGQVTGCFPDVFDPRIERDAAAMAERLRPTIDDPAMIGYFLTNEPSVSWQIDERRGLAASMLFKSPDCASRRALAGVLLAKYGDSAALSKAWGIATTIDAVAHGPWTTPLTEAAHADLTEFSTTMLARLFEITSAACRKVDPNHLNLGVRIWTFPRIWMLRAMGCFDVVSYNYYLPKARFVSYGEKEPEPGVEEVVAKLNRPMMIGEWHVGALDGGLPSAGLTRVRDQAERGKAFRIYQEHAAAAPWLVGAHWFNLYDRNALSGAASNENYNIGFLDLCHLPHEPICKAARATHERLYAVASGAVPPFDEPIEYLHPSR